MCCRWSFSLGETRRTLKLIGDETVDIELPDGVSDAKPRQDLLLRITRADGSSTATTVRSRIDTENEMAYFKSGGILQFVLNNLLAAA